MVWYIGYKVKIINEYPSYAFTGETNYILLLPMQASEGRTGLLYKIKVCENKNKWIRLLLN